MSISYVSADVCSAVLRAVVEAHHALLQSAAVAVAGDGGERLLHRLDCCALGVAGNDNQAVAQLAEAIAADQRSLATVKHVDQLRVRQILGDALDLLYRRRRLDEDHVGASLRSEE